MKGIQIRTCYLQAVMMVVSRWINVIINYIFMPAYFFCSLPIHKPDGHRREINAAYSPVLKKKGRRI